MGRLADTAPLNWDWSCHFNEPNPASDPLTSGFVDPDELFAELDHMEIAAGEGRWRVEVFSISDQEGQRWIQLAVRGRTEQMITLRLHPGAGLAEAVPEVLKAFETSSRKVQP
jgi:hypothetical protein